MAFTDKLLRRKRDITYYKECVGVRLVRWRRRKLRKLSEAQNHRCAYCGKDTHFGPRDNSDRATLEHLIPTSKKSRQTNKDENLVMACNNCNSLRSNKDPMKFFRTIRCKPQPLMIAKQEEKWSNDPEKLAHQKVKQGRCFELAWTIACFWPEAVEPIINYVPKNYKRKGYDLAVNRIRERMYAGEV